MNSSPSFPKSPTLFCRFSPPLLSFTPRRSGGAPTLISARLLRPPRRRRPNTLRPKLPLLPRPPSDPVPTSENPHLREILETWADTYKSPDQRDSADGEDADLISKISRAKQIERVLPRNSSLRRSAIVDSLRAQTILKVVPGVGFTAFCGWCVLWGVTKLFRSGRGEELTRDEVKMLRRKRKARMEKEELEKEELEKGRVEVIQNNAVELTTRFTSRPQLDKEELMKSVTQAKSFREPKAISDSSSDHDFIDKVRDIRQMVRHARELEQGVQSEDGKGEGGDDIASILLATECKDLASSSSAYPVANSVKNESDHDGLIEKKKEIIKDNLESRRNSPDVTLYVDGHDMEIPVRIGAENDAHCSNPSSPNTNVMGNEETTGMNETKSYVLARKESSTSVRRKPKIIRSVKDARHYLATKRRMSTEPKPERDKGLARGNGTSCSTFDNKLDGKTSPKTSESIKVVGSSDVNRSREDDTRCKKLSEKVVDTKLQGKKHVIFQYKDSTKQSVESLCDSEVAHSSLLVDSETSKVRSSSNILLQGYTESRSNLNDTRTSSTAKFDEDHNNIPNQIRKGEIRQASESLDTLSNTAAGGCSVGVTPGNMKQFTDEKVYDPPELNVLSNKGHHYKEAPVTKLQANIDVCETKIKRTSANIDYSITKEGAMKESSELIFTPDITLLAVDSSKESISDRSCSPRFQERSNLAGDLGSSPIKSALDEPQHENDLKQNLKTETSFPQDSDRAEAGTEAVPSAAQNTWLEKNFQQFDPIVNRIGVGFKENYMVAKEKVAEQPSLRPELSELGLMEDDGELEWMNDDNLRKIVFQVRENELAGKDPFHLMDSSDQRVFFEGLESKTEKVNEKLAGLHEWIHSRIENLDYGADGISIDDPLERIMPRWKGPPVDRHSDFHNKFSELRTGNKGNLNTKGDTQGSFDKLEDSQNYEAVSPYSSGHDKRNMSSSGASRSPKTLIESSDGSSRPGKKTGKEHWQHTKKWSQDFLDVYNAETDPEIKSIMKDMGKDLDRWITEKEKKDVADLMTRIPKKKRRYIEKKMEKLTREMKMFGAPAVVSKYREYLDEKEEDYLWWLDLEFVLCIELYTVEDGVPSIGFYSLEMAADLELDPKQHHVVAFEDPGDSKNFCYIVQAHMDMLGSGKAFVVARPPKDTFREAKGNGFNVTVIRRGELKLNVDQTLEEVEEQISEIGSKIYHETIMRERSVDIHSLMKGVMTADKSRSRSKRMLMKPAKS